MGIFDKLFNNNNSTSENKETNTKVVNNGNNKEIQYEEQTYLGEVFW